MRPLFILLLLLTCHASAWASTITWDLRNAAGSSPHSVAGSGFGNVRTFTSGGLTLTATGWGLTGNSQTTLQNAYVGRYGTGLGICNQLEGSSCGDPSHQVDNGGQYDFMLFQVSQALLDFSITIDPFNSWDRDVTYYIGNVISPVDLTGKNMTSGLAGLNFSGPFQDWSTISSDPRTVTINTTGVNTILIGARMGGQNADTDIDRFKIAFFTGTTLNDPVESPEPSTFALLGLGLTAIVITTYKRAR